MRRSDPDTSSTPFFARLPLARMRQLALIGTGCTIMALGLLIAPLPGPGGLPVMVLGGVLVLRNSADARRLFVRMKRRYPRMIGPVDRFRVKMRTRRQRRKDL